MIRDEIKQQRNQLKGKGVRAHLGYFWDYYRIPALVILAVLAVVIYVAAHVLGKKEQALGVIFLNASERTNDVSDQLKRAFLENSDIDTERYEVNIGMALIQSDENVLGSAYDMAAQANIDTSVESGTLDVLVANPSNFQYYTELGDLVDLRDVLNDAQLQTYEGNFYYVDLTELKKTQEAMQNMEYDAPEEDAAEDSGAIADTSMSAEEMARVLQERTMARNEKGVYERPNPETMDDPVPVGIFVTDAPYVQAHELYAGNEAVIGFAQNSSHKTEAVQFLEFLWSAN